jgi:hypothetical protein
VFREQFSGYFIFCGLPQAARDIYGLSGRVRPLLLRSNMNLYSVPFSELLDFLRFALKQAFTVILCWLLFVQ